MGAWVSGAHSGVPMAHISFPELHWHGWLSELWEWMRKLGKPLLIGLPLLATSLAIIGYVGVRIVWRVATILKWRARHKSKRNQA
jgi:uncharacterized protein (DUF2062 family)